MDQISKIIDLFLELEIQKNFFSLKIKNYNFWEYLRIDLCNKIIEEKSNFFQSKNSIDEKRKYYLYPLKITLLIYNRIKILLSKNIYDVILLNQDRSVLYNGKNVNMHIYPIAKYLAKSFKVLLINQSNKSFKDKNINSINEVPVSLLSSVLIYFIKFNKQELIFLNNIQKAIKSSFNLNLDVVEIAKKVFVYKIFYREKRFKKLFKKFNNKIFFYYSDHSSEGIVSAARSLDVKSVELQHSLISPLDIRYRIPSILDTYQTVPDYVFTYGDYWNSFYKAPLKTIAIGFDYFNNSYTKYYKNSQKKLKKNGIIIYSGILSNKNLQAILDELSKALPEKIFYFKLRQEEYGNWRHRYPEYLIKRKNIIFISSDNKPVHSYMNDCTWQIGIDSTLIYEGLAFGLTTFILKTGWFEQMKNIYENNLAFLVTNSKQIIELIVNYSSHTRRIEKNDIFKENVELNVINAVQEIIND